MKSYCFISIEQIEPPEKIVSVLTTVEDLLPVYTFTASLRRPGEANFDCEVKVISIYKPINRTGERICCRASTDAYPAVLSLRVFSVSSFRAYLKGTMLDSNTKAKPAAKVVMVAPMANTIGK